MKIEFSRHILDKSSNIKLHENLSSGSRVVPCGRMDGGKADMTLLIVALRNLANAPKKFYICAGRVHLCVVYGSQQTKKLLLRYTAKTVLYIYIYIYILN